MTQAKVNVKHKFTKKFIFTLFLLKMIFISNSFLLISLISFDSFDSSWSQSFFYQPIKNQCGALGAYVADFLLQFLGYIAYFVPALIFIVCIQGFVFLFQQRQSKINFFILSFKIIGIFSFIVSSTAFFTLNIADNAHFQAGGVLGDIIANEVFTLLNSQNVIFPSILLTIFSLACITLITNLSWIKIADFIGHFVISSSLKMIMLIFSFFQFVFNLKNPKTLDEPKAAVQNIDEINEAKYKVDVFNNISPDEQNVVEESNQFKLNDHQEIINVDEFINKNEIQNSMKIKQSSELSFDIHENLIDENTPTALSQEDEILQYSETSIVLSDDNPDINKDYYVPLKEENSFFKVISPINNLDVKEPQIKSSEQLFNAEELTKSKIFDNTSFIKLDDATDLAESVDEQLVTENTYKSAITHNDITNQEQINDEELNTDYSQSLIHPLLQKRTKPLVKPTTPLPSLELLATGQSFKYVLDPNYLKKRAQSIEKCLLDFKIKAKVVDYLQGPVITRYEIELAPGVKASRISALDKDIARSLSLSSVRVVEVIPGKPYVGIELPNKKRETVYFRDVLDSIQFKEAKSPLTIVLGKDIAGQSVVADLAKMPHLLVAGTTGSGKSVGVNAMILSILFKSQPEDVRFIMIDPKMLELSVYRGIPHLLTDVVTDMKDASNALNWCVNEMERRYRLMSVLGVRNIDGYNEKIKLAEQMGRPIPDPLWKPTDSMDIEMPTLEKLPYIVVMVDEFADLIMSVGKKIEELIARLAQKARAAGIHLVLATQRPSVDVITGLIKANITTRIAFTVSSKIDSRTILDQMGAESLLGMGDMLYLAPNSSVPIRVHGAFVQDQEVHRVVEDWQARGIPVQFIENITRNLEDANNTNDNGFDQLDPLFDQVVEFVVEKQKASISSVQRQFRIGYNRAARIVEQMELQGIVSEQGHNGNREVLAPKQF